MTAQRSSEGTVGHLAEIGEELTAGIAELRGAYRTLRSPNPAVYGLIRAIRAHAREFGARYPATEVRVEPHWDGGDLTGAEREHVWRIYQEAMRNVAKHAGATLVVVRLTSRENAGALEVSDNGRGFRVPPRLDDLLADDHFGLSGAEERATEIGGRLEVESAPGRGTRVRVTIPLGGSEATSVQADRETREEELR